MTNIPNPVSVKEIWSDAGEYAAISGQTAEIQATNHLGDLDTRESDDCPLALEAYRHKLASGALTLCSVTELPNQVSVAHIWTDGDESVGISDECAEIQANGQYLIDLDALDADERRPALEAYRQKLSSVFSDMWNGPAKVMFDFELAALASADQQEHQL